LVANCHQLKLPAEDEKLRLSDVTGLPPFPQKTREGWGTHSYANQVWATRLFKPVSLRHEAAS